MSESFTKGTARNIYIGGSVFFILLFLVLSFDTVRSSPKRDNSHNITPVVAKGKQVWEENNCIGCHTLLGEGSYYAPELGNAYQRLGGTDHIKAFIQTRPAEGIEGRRSMPQFNLSEEELEAVAQFLKYSSGIDTAGWPPNIEG